LTVFFVRGGPSAAEDIVTLGPWHLLGRFGNKYLEFVWGSRFSKISVCQSYGSLGWH